MPELFVQEFLMLYFQTFTKFWDSADAVRIQPISKWAQKEVKILGDSVKSLFYPFSGPDFIHANIFFPNTKKIVMLGGFC